MAQQQAEEERTEAWHWPSTLRPQAKRGKLLLWGSVGSPFDAGMLIWRSADQAEVQAFVKHDPFVVNGLVRHW